MEIARGRGLALAATVVVAAAVGSAVSTGFGTAESDAGIRRTSDVAARLVVLPDQAASWWGGVYTLETGERVRLYFSDAYPADPTLATHWLSFLARLVHGKEISRVTIYFGTPDVVTAMCGRDALACYALDENAIVTVGEDVPGARSVERLLAHEYGHHVANNRSNAPWPALDWGTKRWATYENVCARERAGDAFPGDEGRHYTLNPGEAFAEAYRVLTDAREGLSYTWSLVDPTFAPNATALALLQRDVLEPWAPSTDWIRGKLAPGGRSTTVRIATPRDGRLSLRLTVGSASNVAVSGTPTLRRGKDGTYAGTICGSRQALARLTSRSGGGRYALRVVKP